MESPPPPDDPFQDHLLRVLSLYDTPAAASVPIPRYQGPHDWRTDAILAKVEALLGARKPPAKQPPPAVNGAKNGIRRSATPSLGSLSPPDESTLNRAAPRPGSPDSESSYITALDELEPHSNGKSDSSGSSDTENPHPRRVSVEGFTSYHDFVAAFKAIPRMPYDPDFGSTPPFAALPTCPQCGHRPRNPAAFFAAYDESPGVVPVNGALASAVTQGGMDALEELKYLKDQVRDVARVCKAVAMGDLNQKITVPVQGELMVQLKQARVINSMVDNLSVFATEVTRVSRDVGTEGKLGAQAHIDNVEGTWRELKDEVNTLAQNLTTQVRSIAEVTTAVANGDLSKQIDVPAKGEVLNLKNTVNGMVLRLRTLAVEVTRVTLEVGNQGILGGAATVPDVEGVWSELVTNVNRMCLTLTDQVRSIASVTTAVAQGDLSQKVTIEAEGEISTLKDTVNRMVDQLSAFASEVTRVALEVGTEGKLGGQAQVEGVLGTWKDLTDNVNKMASNLTGQVRSISEVTKAVANGDLNMKMEVDVSGEMLDLKVTINEMVNRLGRFSREVTRVALEVGTEGKLGGQAKVEGVQGTWKDLTDNVNKMAFNLTNQVRAISKVTKAVAYGDLTKSIDVDVAGEMLDLKNTINEMVSQLGNFSREVTRVALEVGTEGKLGGQAEVDGVQGTWKDLTDNVNKMASNLTSQVRAISKVTKAVAYGDLTREIDVDVAGEMLDLKITINEMVERLGRFSREVTRVALEVGTEGKLGGQAEVEGVQGIWKDLTDNVNKMASNLTSQVRAISKVTKAVAYGDLTREIDVDVAGEMLDLKVTINEMVDRLGNFSREVTRVALEVGTEGKLGGQAEVEGVQGIWKDLTDNVNKMASNLTNQVRTISKVTKAVALGDLTQTVDVDVKGEMLDLKITIDDMVSQLSTFASEVTRVALEVGTEGKLGGQAEVEGVQGTWKDLTNNVNKMASNLTEQVRTISKVTKAVALGDLTQIVDVDVKGEMLDLKMTINDMVSQLQTFSSEVTRVALEVGTEGKLGGQATVDGVQGTWKDLTDNVNKMASNLTLQVRSISTVTKAVAYGDLTKTIEVDVAGEMLDLKVTINEMVERLGTFSNEVTKVALDVGTYGQLGGQAKVEGVQGTWKSLTDNVNKMASNLTAQVRAISEVTKAVAFGDLSQTIEVDVSGEMLDLTNTINEMVSRLQRFASEVTRVALEVGTDGKLGGQAEVEGVQGTWKDLTDNVNRMASNLTNQVRAISKVTKAVAYGDLTKTIDVDVAGEMLDLKITINEMVERLGNFSSEVTKLALDVGTYGKLGGQAQVEGAQGTWKDLTDNVNKMASNLTAQVRGISLVTKAVAYGDLTNKIEVDVSGEMLDLKVTINEMVERLLNFSSEVTRVALDVGTEGKLGGQAEVEGVQGTWKDLTTNVNKMASNLTNQVRAISKVTKAVALGDLTQTVDVDVKGEMLDLKVTINDMVAQLGIFASEVTRVALEVGTDGKLGGQAQVEGVQGTWKDLTDNVNKMASNLTAQVRSISEVTTAVAQGDLSKTIEVDVKGEMLDLKSTINAMVDQLGNFSREVTRVALEVGTDGRLGGQAEVEGNITSNLTSQVRTILRVTKAVALGDLSQNIEIDVKGEMLDLKVTRVALEVGTQGKLGGQASREDDRQREQKMALIITDQVRNISRVTTAVAQGDLTQKVEIDVEGEMLNLKSRINDMVSQSSIFASKVIQIAFEVGTDGKLGGQALVEGVQGSWKTVTDNANRMADNLTTQVRSIAAVTKAVAVGDLTKQVDITVKGEILALKDTVNAMAESLNAAEVTRVAREVGTEGRLGGQAKVEGVQGT
ncbi:hypothetical protein HMN09_00792200 [Mycena chlorophos]|uniref:HAMP domain-containing protein n=1 Tax=Mycena chlorophos TaxID=658473 RepID=A0A8H6ST97_MYCCL|nr:hypothetical protein HMN09_00792200 [Mycena chlorophos]